jgi:hypothetical protein
MHSELKTPLINKSGKSTSLTLIKMTKKTMTTRTSN